MSIPVLSLAALPLTILFATETGNAGALAETAAAAGVAMGARVRLRDMATYNTTGIASEQNILAITSTHGEGAPPQSALDFFEFLDATDVNLRHVHFAVLALGDSGYDAFCEAGKRLDRRLSALGATRIVPRRDIDVGEMKAAREWVDVMMRWVVEHEAASKLVPSVGTTDFAGSRS